MFRWFRDLRALRTDRRILDLQARLEEKDRLISVLKAEVDSMAGVIARDRARVAAETARFTREQAEAEGGSDDGRHRESHRRFSA